MLLIVGAEMGQYLSPMLRKLGWYPRSPQPNQATWNHLLIARVGARVSQPAHQSRSVFGCDDAQSAHVGEPHNVPRWASRLQQAEDWQGALL